MIDSVTTSNTGKVSLNGKEYTYNKINAINGNLFRNYFIMKPYRDFVLQNEQMGVKDTKGEVQMRNSILKEKKSIMRCIQEVCGDDLENEHPFEGEVYSEEHLQYLAEPSEEPFSGNMFSPEYMKWLMDESRRKTEIMMYYQPELCYLLSILLQDKEEFSFEKIKELSIEDFLYLVKKVVLMIDDEEDPQPSAEFQDLSEKKNTLTFPTVNSSSTQQE